MTSSVSVLKFLTISSRNGFTCTLGPAVRLRILGRDSRCDRFQLGARLFDRHAFLHLADALEEKIPARMIFLIHLQAASRCRKPPGSASPWA